MNWLNTDSVENLSCVAMRHTATPLFWLGSYVDGASPERREMLHVDNCRPCSRRTTLTPIEDVSRSQQGFAPRSSQRS
eukprot:CAMPEP_0114561618 /NCGR_PEP_ID=MMETSP0114-20121206/12099_1 /TAXON_ID=31324 /ORGANISM="Goniomonas sp, Strain m" /LENGTH=77 /DNA_ID=CAMNT_0001747263 /DNA_START=62 /DNA_END=295 /DNA_ORIENTATION=-